MNQIIQILMNIVRACGTTHFWLKYINIIAVILLMISQI